MIQVLQRKHFDFPIYCKFGAYKGGKITYWPTSTWEPIQLKDFIGKKEFYLATKNFELSKFDIQNFDSKFYGTLVVCLKPTN